MSVTLILGGARSGKSSRAQQLAEAASPTRTFVATAEPLDDEMASRIARHQADRGEGWTTREAPMDLAGALHETMRPGHVVLVDCLTLWLSNLVFRERDVSAETQRLLEALALPGELILVSNEIGLGLVPETPLGRSFRDQQGWLNQAVAEASDRVEFVAAGLPLLLK
ncbi:MAG: bifunctional adenosylcobinamide kinase/adenosylcobinamide-phosphate guanylyltransferase [Pseudomonadota bacterium]